MTGLGSDSYDIALFKADLYFFLNSVYFIFHHVVIINQILYYYPLSSYELLMVDQRAWVH